MVELGGTATSGQEMVPKQEQNLQSPSPYGPVAAVQAPAQTSSLPVTPAMAKQTYSSRMSYVGSTRRTVAWAKRVGARSAVLAVTAWTLGVLFLVFMYVFLVAWYLVVFVLFGFFTFPFRLIRRGQRKSQHLQEAQLATMQAMLQQQQSLAQRQPPTAGTPRSPA